MTKNAVRLLFLFLGVVCLTRPCLSDEAYHPRSAAIDDALTRAELAYARGVSEPQKISSLPQISDPEEPSSRPGSWEPSRRPSPAVEIPAQPPRVSPKSTALPAAAVSDRAAVVDEALDRYLDFQRRENTLNAGIEIFNYTYEEEMFMEQKATMYGVFADYRFRFRQNSPIASFRDVLGSGAGVNMLMFDTRFSFTADGRYTSDGSGELRDEKYHSHETRLMGGYEFPIEEKRLIVMPYAGFGYRYLKDNNGGRMTSVGHYSYDRESRYFYLPIGIEARKFYQRGWSARLTGEYDWFLSGRQHSHLPIDDGGTAGKYQPKGYGLRGSLRIARETEGMEFFVEPFARYWHIGDSNVGFNFSGGYVEPRNTTEEYGAKIGVRF